MSSKSTTSRKGPTRGLILMLDALGISSYSMEECQYFLEKFNQLRSEFQKKRKGSLGILSFNYVLFGDTIIIYVPIDSDFENSLPTLALVGYQISEIFEWGFKNKILFRGAIAIGDYLADDNFVLGPAMFDANTWCEAADWFGIIFTPKSRLWIESMRDKFVKSNKDDLFKLLEEEPVIVQYDVPLSKPINDKKSKNFLTYNWTNLLFVDDLKQNETRLQKFLDLVYEFPTSKEGEPKIEHGVKYFKDMISKTNL